MSSGLGGRDRGGLGAQRGQAEEAKGVEASMAADVAGREMGQASWPVSTLLCIVTLRPPAQAHQEHSCRHLSWGYQLPDSGECTMSDQGHL